jgi:hypothetical protein
MSVELKLGAADDALPLPVSSEHWCQVIDFKGPPPFVPWGISCWLYTTPGLLPDFEWLWPTRVQSRPCNHFLSIIWLICVLFQAFSHVFM